MSRGGYMHLAKKRQVTDMFGKRQEELSFKYRNLYISYNSPFKSFICNDCGEGSPKSREDVIHAKGCSYEQYVRPLKTEEKVAS